MNPLGITTHQNYLMGDAIKQFFSLPFIEWLILILFVHIIQFHKTLNRKITQYSEYLEKLQ